MAEETLEVAPSDDAGDIVKAKYDAVVNDGLQGSKSRLAAVASSGFGKGALITAAITVVVSAALMGVVASGGGMYIDGIIAPVDQGIATGIASALKFLTHGAGLALMAVGGIIGMKMDLKKHKEHSLSVEQAQEKAREQEQSRSRIPEKVITSTPDTAQEASTPAVPEVSFCERENQRRIQNAAVQERY